MSSDLFMFSGVSFFFFTFLVLKIAEVSEIESNTEVFNYFGYSALKLK